MNYPIYFIFFSSLILSHIGLPKIKRMLIKSNILCENYKLVKIPTSMGITFVFVQVITLGLFKIIFGLEDDFVIIYLFAYIFIGFLGLIDDLIGDKNIKGIRGHLKSAINNDLTTGGLKAIFGLFIAIIISCIFFRGVNIIINALIIGLFTNLINLFDLRPGRAAKVFIFISLIFVITSPFKIVNYILVSLLGILLPYMHIDIKGKAMMGDVGSNVLGFSLGIYASYSFNIICRMSILILLVIFHVIAERYSLTKIIKKSKLLNILDNIGR